MYHSAHKTKTSSQNRWEIQGAAKISWPICISNINKKIAYKKWFCNKIDLFQWLYWASNWIPRDVLANILSLNAFHMAKSHGQDLVTAIWIRQPHINICRTVVLAWLLPHPVCRDEKSAFYLNKIRKKKLNYIAKKINPIKV